jgi:hypothetical protein
MRPSVCDPRAKKNAYGPFRSRTRLSSKKCLTRGEENIPQTIQIKQSPCQLAHAETRRAGSKNGFLTGRLKNDDRQECICADFASIRCKAGVRP